jgi:hypothetical protein
LIVSILDDSVIEVATSVEDGPVPIKNLVMLPNSSSLLKSLRWKHVNQQIWLLGTVVLGINTTFTEQFQVKIMKSFVYNDFSLIERRYSVFDELH